MRSPVAETTLSLVRGKGDALLELVVVGVAREDGPGLGIPLGDDERRDARLGGSEHPLVVGEQRDAPAVAASGWST